MRGSMVVLVGLVAVMSWGFAPPVGGPTTSTWTDLGSGLAGGTGIPQLVGSGGLSAGDPFFVLILSNAKPQAPAMLYFTLSNQHLIPQPFKCGALYPVPGFKLLLFTSGGGGISLSMVNHPVVPSSSMYFQYAIVDPAAVCGVSLSNALRMDTV